MEVIVAATLPSVAGFTFTVGGKIAKIDALLFQPDPGHFRTLIDLIQTNGSPCKTPNLRCDDQGEYGGYVNTQGQLGGTEDYVERNKPTQSTSFSQVNVSFAARRNGLCNQALSDAHEYSYRTQKVVTIDLAAGTATQVVTSKKFFKCSNCSYNKAMPKPNADVPAKCPQCKKPGTITSV